ncbi:MAG: chemotaxis protein CheW [Actinomycetota bacterium]|nr:MAG: chemotaxis protein CheW [Actinomycetota bacterium]
MSSTQVCTFRIGERIFGVQVAVVQEVFRSQAMTSVPLAPSVVRGLINLRGEIVTALDLRRRLGLADHGASEDPMNVVVRTTKGVVSFLVDEIGDVVSVDQASFEAPPETLDDEVRPFISGIFKLDHGLLVLLDVERCADVSAVAADRNRGKGDR